MPVRNLDYIKSQDPRLYEALSDIIGQQSNIAEQVNGNVSGQPLAPPSISGIQVSAKNGHFQVAIQDPNPVYRDVHYYIEHADNPNFTNSQVVHNGHSRNWGGFLGNVTRYFRAYSGYASSAPGSPAYHGGLTNPQPVKGGGFIGGPSFLNGQASGTGFPGQGVTGSGPIPFRAVNGAPPVRGENTGTGASANGQSSSIASGGLPPINSAGVSGGTAAPGGGSSAAGGLQIVPVTQSGLSTLASSLTSGSQLIAYVTDYDHFLYWTGTAWSMIADRSGYIAAFDVDPSPTTGWHLCDGSTVSKLNSDGSLSSVTLENLIATPAYIKMGTPASNAINVAVAPTFTGSGTGTTGSAVTGVTLPANTGAPSATTSVTAGSVAVASATHTHSEGSVSDPGHTHSLPSPSGTISTTGEPANTVKRPWYRL